MAYPSSRSQGRIDAGALTVGTAATVQIDGAVFRENVATAGPGAILDRGGATIVCVAFDQNSGTTAGDLALNSRSRPVSRPAVKASARVIRGDGFGGRLASPPSLATTLLRAESVVLGANAVILLGEPKPVSRVGFGVDVGYQLQLFMQEGEYINGDFVVWAREVPHLNYGPVLHVWRAGAAWNAGLTARAGVMWPLRMGLIHGWWPGPALTVEVGPALSTAGYAGLDLQAAADLPWMQGRVATTWTRDGLHARRLHLGVFAPLEQPQLWEEPNSGVWDPSDLER